MRSNLMITASLSLLFALPSAARAAAFSVNIQRIGGQPQAKGEVVTWSIAISANTRTTQRVTVTVFNVADPAKGHGATTTRTATLTVGAGAVPRMEVATWGERPKVRTTAAPAKPAQTQPPQQQEPAAGSAPAKAAPEGPAASRQPAAPAKPASPTTPANPTVPGSASKPAPNQPPAQAPTPGQKPSQR